MERTQVLAIAVLLASCGESDKTPSAGSPRAMSPARRDPCALLASADFAAVGLNEGKPKRESNMSGGACTWTGVRGKGGFLTVAFITEAHYNRRDERLDDKATTVADIGDEASIAKRLAGYDIAVKLGTTYVLIDGNARLTPEMLPTLARAVLARLEQR